MMLKLLQNNCIRKTPTLLTKFQPLKYVSPCNFGTNVGYRRKEHSPWQGEIYNDLNRMVNSFNKLFDITPFGRDLDISFDQFRDKEIMRPFMDFIETDKHYILKCDLPGVPKENISVEVEGSQIRIRAEKLQEKEEDEGEKEGKEGKEDMKGTSDTNFSASEKETGKESQGETQVERHKTSQKKEKIVSHQIERCVGKYERVVTLDHDIDPKTVNVSFKEGVLKVKVPKAHASTQTHKISF